MRLHRLQVNAFGPFAGREEIDFDDLASTGLYLIHGTTGAGKTSILDAICFALYAAVPGARAGARRSLRSDHAAVGSVPEVTLELTASGRRLRVVRSPEFERPKLRGAGTTTVQARVVLEELVGGTWRERATRNDEAALVIDDVVGMGLEQFVKVVLLPQGDFAAFLRASPEQRREVLERLFDIQRFTDIEDWLAQCRRAATAALGAARDELRVGLARIDEVLAGLPAPAVDAHPGGDAPEANPRPAEGPRWPLWDNIAQDDLASVLATVRVQVTLSANKALAEAELAQGHEDTAAANVGRGRVVAAHQQTARTARATSTSLAKRQNEYDHTADVVALAERAATLEGHLAAEEQAGQELARARELAEDRRASLGAGPGAHLGGLADLEEVVRLIAVLQTQTAPLATLSSHADHARRQGVEVARLTDAIDGHELELSASQSRHRRLGVKRADAAAAHQETMQLAAALSAREATIGTLTRAALLLAQQRDDGATMASLDAELAQRTHDAHAAESTVLSLRQRRLDDMAGELATGLTDGTDCPVCGSRSHPHPARQADPVTADDIAAAEAAAATAMAGRESVRTRLTGLRARHAARVDELSAVLAGRDPADVKRSLPDAQALLEQARMAAEALPVLATRVQELTQSREDAEQLIERDRRARDAATARVEAARQQVVEATEAVAEGLRVHLERCACAAVECEEGAGAHSTAYGAVLHTHQETLRRLADLADSLKVTAATARALGGARARLTVALADHGFDDAAAARDAGLPAAEVAQLSQRLRAMDRERHQAEALLSQPDVVAAEALPAPDLVAMEARHKAMREAALQARRAQAVAEAADHRIRDLGGEVIAVLARISPLAVELQVLQELADCVAGTSPNNTLRMRLSSYLLAARLEEVARLANERLARMSEGRYTLEYTDALAKRGARSGLGLRVHDAWTGTTRETSTLSGGESFMASLSLALGLGDAVRAEAGGFDLQTLFVDEGFGTLDEDSLEQVMGVLDRLREGGRAVGIVSHVSELRQRITAQVLVEKTPSGSRIRA